MLSLVDVLLTSPFWIFLLWTNIFLGMMKAKKKEAEVEKLIKLSIAPRGKKKAVTVVQGLKTFGIDLKVASKFFGQKFACGASITGDDEIVIQGDFKDDLFDLIPEKWEEVNISTLLFQLLLSVLMGSLSFFTLRHFIMLIALNTSSANYHS